jgi:peptidyl-tRNA hydrolase, PTH1 family
MTGENTRIIAGLGNPGERYAWTRHNVGFMVVDLLAREAGSAGWRRESRALVCRVPLEGHETVLVRPLTYMNLSGPAVAEAAERRRAGAGDLVVLLDDLNLPFGRIRIRNLGSGGGHHGLESVIRALGTDEFMRVRLGVGEEDMPEDRADFVLSEFPGARREALDEMIRRAGEAVRAILRDGAAKAMSVYNA